jgi:predicted lysophospholipase L1 biosynthesis ABC-type transport system permease subunit
MLKLEKISKNYLSYLLSFSLSLSLSLSLPLALSLSVGNLKSSQRRTTLEMIAPTMTMLNRSSSQVSEHKTLVGNPVKRSLEKCNYIHK